MNSDDTHNPLEGFDFSLLRSPEFQEDSVREEIIKPILDFLGYKVVGPNRIRRSVKLKHPFVNIGSTERAITLIPDYTLEVQDGHRWILDAKAPGEPLSAGPNVEQAYSYAIHPDVRARVFALCDGFTLAAFAIDQSDPILTIPLSELGKHIEALKAYLAPEAFSAILSAPTTPKTGDFAYSAAELVQAIRAKKQGAKRHFGVHGYFTRQSWDVVQEHIKNFTKPGDVVLDPFGGYGVTALESLMLGRKAIHVDINPLSVFIMQGLVAPVDLSLYWNEFEDLHKAFIKHRPTKESLQTVLQKYPHPTGILLAKEADVSTVDQLFSPQQTADLALLKHLITKIMDDNVRSSMLLAFSSTITKTNLTYHPSSSRGENAGDSAAFRYYRYRLAPRPVELDTWETFALKVHKLAGAKREIAGMVNSRTIKDLTLIRGTATNLSELKSESVDYIYTDPPYGAKIAYLDLSSMWNAWLDLKVTDADFAMEAIEGGTREKTKESYSSLIYESIREMCRVLRYDRWLSFVFQHKDPAYWHLIVESAQACGFEYVGTTTQVSGQTTFKKRQNPFTVLHGQLIINFRKVPSPRALMKIDLGAEVADIIIDTAESLIARNAGATLEEIYNVLIVRGMELGFLHELSKRYQDLTPLLVERFDFDPEARKYQIRKNTRFKSQIPLNVRIRYYLLSYMRQSELRGYYPTFDEIILNLMPLLKNGVTPATQTILSVLEQNATRVAVGRWKLRRDGQQEMFEREIEN